MRNDNGKKLLKFLIDLFTQLYKELLIGTTPILQVAIEAIYVSIQAIVYSLILFFMIGFEWKVGKLLWFFYFYVTSLMYFTLYGMMLVALTPNQQISAILMSSIALKCESPRISLGFGC